MVKIKKTKSINKSKRFNIKRESRQTSKKNDYPSSIDTIDLLKDSFNSKKIIDSPSGKLSDCKFAPKNIAILCSLVGFVNKDFLLKDKNIAVLYFYEQLLNLEKLYKGVFVEDLNGDICFKQNQYHNDNVDFLPYDFCNICLYDVWNKVSIDLWNILCPIIFSLRGNCCSSVSYFVETHIENYILIKKDDLEESNEYFEDDLKEVTAYEEKYGINGTLVIEHPELFKVYTKKQINKAWQDLHKLHCYRVVNRTLNDNDIISAFYCLYPIRNSKDTLHNYINRFDIEDCSELSFLDRIFFYWDNDHFSEMAMDNLSDWGNNEAVCVEPYLIKKLEYNSKITNTNNKFLMAIHNFIYKLIT